MTHEAKHDRANPPAAAAAPHRGAPSAVGGRAPRAGWERLAIAGILLGAAALRLAALERLPPGMSQDELIRGYDAWSLWETGRDFHGVAMPAYLEAFGPGDYPAAISAYLTAPLTGLFGLRQAVVRLPIALSAIATVYLLWRWMRREFGAVAALAAAASLAMSPWHLFVSRMGFEGLLTPFLVTCGFAWLVRAPQENEATSAAGIARRKGFGQWWKPIAAGFCLGAAMWTYAAPRFLLPLLLAAWGLLRVLAARTANDAEADRSATAATRMSRRIRSPSLLPFLIGLLAGAAPMVTALVRHPEQVFARPRHITTVGRQDFSETVERVAAAYARHFDPRYFCMSGEPIAQFLKYRYRFAHTFEGPLILLGALILLSRARRSPVAGFLLLWLLLYPVPAALADDLGPHYVRSILGLPLLPILVGIAAAEVIGRLARFGRAVGATAVAGLLLLSAQATTGIARYYFGEFAADIGSVYRTDLPDAFRWLRETGRPYDVLLVLFPRNQAFAIYLFHARVEPCAARQAEIERRPWVQGFEHVLRLGGAWFCPPPSIDPNWTEQEAPRIIRAQPPGTRIILIELPGQTPQIPAIHAIRNADGQVELTIHELVVPPLPPGMSSPDAPRSSQPPEPQR